MISRQLLKKILINNYDATCLIYRCFPEQLFTQYRAKNSKNHGWNDKEWDIFFDYACNIEVENATIIWNDSTRSELTRKL